MVHPLIRKPRMNGAPAVVRCCARRGSTILKIRLIAIAFLFVLACAHTWAADEFADVKCGSDIPQALIGKHVSDGPAAASESRHKGLGLKNLGGDEISDRLFLASWKICGSEYELLVNTKQNLIRDVLAFPPHSATSPMFVGTCQVQGKTIPSVVAILNNSAGHNARDHAQAKTMLQVTVAWKLDEAKEKFEKLSTENLTCPLGDIVTEDGGR